MANLLLRKILWTQNSNLVVEEDGEDIFNEGDDDESAWQRALRPCLEVIAKIGELHPDPVVGVVVLKIFLIYEKKQWIVVFRSRNGCNYVNGLIKKERNRTI